MPPKMTSSPAQSGQGGWPNTPPPSACRIVAPEDTLPVFAERRNSSSDYMWRQELRERTFSGDLRAPKPSEGGLWPSVALEMDGSDVVCTGMSDLVCRLTRGSRQSYQG